LQEQPTVQRNRAQQVLENLMASEVETIRLKLLSNINSNHLPMESFLEAGIAFWNKWLDVDRVFVCDMKTGIIVAGWNKGKNIITLQDWDSTYVPLDDDETLQEALAGEELVASPTKGVGADLAFSLNLADGNKYLVVLDQTQVARVFSDLDMAYISLVRDLAVIKSKLLL